MPEDERQHITDRIRLTHTRAMANELQSFGEQLRKMVFDWLDSHPDYTGDEAGQVAHKTEHAFLSACVDLE